LDGKTIKVTDDVHQKLTELGKKSETYSEIISRLIDFYNENHPVKEKENKK